MGNTNKNIHDNSRKSLREISPEIKGRKLAIMNVLLDWGMPMTDRQILYALKIGTDPNFVRPRITEMLKEGILEEIDSVRCAMTEKAVRRVQPKRTERQTEFAL